MMKILLTIILLTISQLAFSQIKAVVVDKENQKKLEYVNIWVEDKNIGTSSDNNGVFELPGVNIFLKDTKIAVQTDFDGKFSITIPSNKLNEENYLVFSFIGFETQEYRFYKKNRYINIKMVEDNVLLGEVVVVRRANIFNKIGHFFSKLFSKKENHMNCQ